MNRNLFLYFTSFFIFSFLFSCNTTISKSETDFTNKVNETESVIENNNNLSKQFEEVKSNADKIKTDFERSKEKFFKIHIEHSGEYDGGNKAWYFNPSFELLYFEKYVAVEGGEEFYDFYAQDRSGMILEYHNDKIESEIDEKIWVRNNNKYYERKGNMNDDNYKYSFYETTTPLMYSYEEVFSEIPVDFNKFTYNNGFHLLTSKKVESEYGEVEVKNDVFIDSLLFVHLFGNKITEKAN